MEITVYNQNREVIYILDAYESLIWTDRYSEPGDFELVTPVSNDLLSILAKDNYISIPKSEDWMIIEKLRIKTGEDGPDKLFVTGRSLLSLFDRRQEPSGVAFGLGGIPPILYTASFVNRMMVEWAFSDTSPAVAHGAEKEVSYIGWEYSTDPRIIGAGIGIELPVDFRTAVSTRNMLDKMLSISTLWGVGLKAYVDSNKNFIFTVYLGLDRTKNQTDNAVVIFSQEFENLQSSDWSIDNEPYRNVIYTAGAADPPPQHRSFYWLNKEAGDPNDIPSGINRRERFFPGDHISAYVHGTTTEKTYDEYEEDLILFAKEQLENSKALNDFFGEVLDNPFRAGEHYFLGDFIQFENKYGFSGISMVTEITYSVNISEDKTYPTLEFLI